MRLSEPALLVAAFAVSGLATAWARAHARRRGLVDQPGDRRSHELPTPRGGGIGIALVGLFLWWYARRAAARGWLR